MDAVSLNTRVQNIWMIWCVRGLQCNNVLQHSALARLSFSTKVLSEVRFNAPPVLQSSKLQDG